jgi:hypothetical protein
MSNEIKTWRGEEYPSNFQFDTSLEAKPLPDGTIIGIAVAYLPGGEDRIIVYREPGSVVVTMSQKKYDEKYKQEPERK